MSQPANIKLNVNGRAVEVTTESERSLLEVLREDLVLTGTKYGCGEGACGACTVLLDGRPTLSCTTMASEAAGKKLQTIEGLADGDELHPVQRAFCDAMAYQCGYCTPGMIMASISLLKENPDATEQEIRDGLEGNLCRCTGYENIVKAVQWAQTHVDGQAQPAAS